MHLHRQAVYTVSYRQMFPANCKEEIITNMDLILCVRCINQNYMEIIADVAQLKTGEV